jgi:hypothetical protein
MSMDREQEIFAVPLTTSAKGADPAIEAVRKCDAALQAFKATIADSDGADVVDDEASAASIAAWYELFTVTPTTVAGAAALASYMAAYSKEEGGVDTAQEALTALAASLQKFVAVVDQDGGHGTV